MTKRRVTKIEVTSNDMNITPLKKQYMKMFKIAYTGLKQFHLETTELKALNLVYFLTKKKKQHDLQTSFEIASKTHNVDIDKLRSLWASRMNHMRYAKLIIKEILEETYEIKQE
jgi:hypothetical protein